MGNLPGSGGRSLTETSRKESCSERPRGIASQLETFIAIQILLAAACLFTELICLVKMHLRGAFDYPFLEIGPSYWDFTVFAHRFQFFHHPEFFKTDTSYIFMYPAPAAVFYKIFFCYHAHPLLLFLAFTVASFVIAGFLLGLALRRRGIHHRLGWCRIHPRLSATCLPFLV